MYNFDGITIVLNLTVLRCSHRQLGCLTLCLSIKQPNITNDCSVHPAYRTWPGLKGRHGQLIEVNNKF